MYKLIFRLLELQAGSYEVSGYDGRLCLHSQFYAYFHLMSTLEKLGCLKNFSCQWKLMCCTYLTFYNLPLKSTSWLKNCFHSISPFISLFGNLCPHVWRDKKEFSHPSWGTAIQAELGAGEKVTDLMGVIRKGGEKKGWECFVLFYSVTVMPPSKEKALAYKIHKTIWLSDFSKYFVPRKYFHKIGSQDQTSCFFNSTIISQLIKFKIGESRLSS